MNRFVVATTGRSGSCRVAWVLRSLGCLCGHEDVFTHGYFNAYKTAGQKPPLDWGHLHGDCSYWASASLEVLPSDVVVFQLVRDPRYVARSFMTVAPKIGCHAIYEYMLHHGFISPSWKNRFGELAPPELFLEYWLQCHTMIESVADRNGRPFFRFRIEDLQETSLGGGVPALRCVSDLIGLKHTDARLLGALHLWHEKSNSSEPSGGDVVSWDAVPTGVAELARRYGYLV